MTPQRRRTAAIVLGVLLVLGGALVINRLTQPEPNLDRCIALSERASTDAERDKAFDSPLCKDLRDMIR